MKWIIEFTTDLFNSTESKPHFINDRCFGEDLIEWFAKNFDNPGFQFDTAIQEDWGWAAYARKDGETFLVGVGIMDESIGSVPARWLLLVEKTRRFIVFGSKRSPNLDVLADAAEELLRKESQITDIERYPEG